MWSSGGKLAAGNNLQLWACNGHNNQQFVGMGNYQFASGEDQQTFWCWDLWSADTTNGKQIEVSKCTA